MKSNLLMSIIKKYFYEATLLQVPFQICKHEGN